MRLIVVAPVAFVALVACSKKPLATTSDAAPPPAVVISTAAPPLPDLPDTPPLRSANVADSEARRLLLKEPGALPTLCYI